MRHLVGSVLRYRTVKNLFNRCVVTKGVQRIPMPSKMNRISFFCFQVASLLKKSLYQKKIFAFCERLSQRFLGCLYSFGIFLLLFVVNFVFYWPSLHGDFVFDDRPAILDNKNVRGPNDWLDVFRNDYWGAPIYSVR